MANNRELRQAIILAQRNAQYHRGRRDALQHALGLLSDISTTAEGKRAYARVAALLAAAQKEALAGAAELDAAYEAYNHSLR